MSSFRPRRTLRFPRLCFALCLLAALPACNARQGKTPDARSVQEPAPVSVANPMASFARLVGGEWRVTALSGKSMFHAWHWGPGKHSLRRMTDGSGAGGEPWRELKVVYWHPGRKQGCLLGLSPYARGVSEGTIEFAGETAEGGFDLHQTGARRKMGLRWVFDGPDKYHDTLLEATGKAGLEPLVEFDQVRVTLPATPRSRTVEGAKPSARLKALEALLGHTWEARGKGATRDAFHTRATFEWVPLADAISARVLEPGKDGESTHLLDAYLYHHTGANALRCLALSNRGGVYEGDVTARDGGLHLDLEGHEGGQVAPFVARLDFEKDGTLRLRVWSLAGTEHTLLLDAHHEKHPPK